MALSKQQRKKMRRDAEAAKEEKYKNELWVVHIVSMNSDIHQLSPEIILKECKKFGVNLQVSKESSLEEYKVYPPMAKQFDFLNLHYSNIDGIELNYDNLLSEYEISDLAGKNSITLFSKTNLSVVNDFMMMCMLRAVGRLTGEVLIDEGRDFIMDDGASWSLDYMKGDMFNSSRVYDSNSPGYKDLPLKYPSLKFKKQIWNIW